MTLQERLLAFIASQKISVSKFETMCSLSNGYIRGVRDTIGSDKLVNILRAYPNLSSSWLLTGIGPMENSFDKIGTSGVQNIQQGINSFSNNADLDKVLLELHKKDEQVDRLLKLLEHIVFKNEGQF